MILYSMILLQLCELPVSVDMISAHMSLSSVVTIMYIKGANLQATSFTDYFAFCKLAALVSMCACCQSTISREKIRL